MSRPEDLSLEQQAAMLMATVVRNDMEDFRSAYLSEVQMASLDPIIRNALYTALHAMKRMNTSAPARDFVRFHTMCIGTDWEPPTLTQEFAPMRKARRPRTAKKAGRNSLPPA
jgi:hypothetical protein